MSALSCARIEGRGFLIPEWLPPIVLSIYNEGGKRALIENVNAALPYMDADMRELAKRTLSKVDALTEAEFAELPIYAADEV